MCDLKSCEIVVLVVRWCCIVLQMKAMEKSVHLKSPSRIAAWAKISTPWFMEQYGSQLLLQAPSVIEMLTLHKDKETKNNDQDGSDIAQ